MGGQRLAECMEPVANSEDPADRSNLDNHVLRESCGSYIPAEHDSQNLEMWRRVLAASIQPPPSAAERPALAPLIEPEWLREVYRGTREDVRRLLQPGRRESRSGSTSRSSALVSRGPTRLG